MARGVRDGVNYMHRPRRTFVFLLALGLPLCVCTLSLRAEEARDSVQVMSASEIENAFLGDWRDNRDRWWFGIDSIEDTEVRAARFRLAHLKEGQIEGTRLSLVSTACLFGFACYDYFIEAELVSPDTLDMTATSDTCNFERRCREAGEVAHYILTRE